MNNHQITVMLLGGGRRVSVAELLKKSGERLGFEMRLISYELTEQVPISILGKVVRGLPFSDPAVVDDIVRVATENEADIILPFVDGAIEIAAKVREKIPDVFVPVSDFATCQKMFDKVEAAKAFKDAGIPIPATYSVISAEVPAIAKPRKGTLSRGLKIFFSMDELMHLENLSGYLIQEYIDNRKEYTVDCYVTQQGEILVTVPRLRIEVMGGEVCRTETCRIGILEDMSRQVIRALNLRGPVTIQYLYDINSDRYLLMEVNPRLGGGVACSIFAGAPIPDYILKESLGIPMTPCDDWSDHTLMARYQKEVIFYNK